MVIDFSSMVPTKTCKHHKRYEISSEVLAPIYLTLHHFSHLPTFRELSHSSHSFFQCFRRLANSMLTLLLVLASITSNGPLGRPNVICTSCLFTLILPWANGMEQEQVSNLRTHHTASSLGIISACKCKKPLKPISYQLTFAYHSNF